VSNEELIIHMEGREDHNTANVGCSMWTQVNTGTSVEEDKLKEVAAMNAVAEKKAIRHGDETRQK